MLHIKMQKMSLNFQTDTEFLDHVYHWNKRFAAAAI